MSKTFMIIPALTLVAAATLSAQTTPTTTEVQEKEFGALTLSTDGGVSMGFPAVRASAVVGNTTALSPKKTVLPTVGFTASIRAWKFLAPYADFNVIDTGKATASVGPVSSAAQADTFTFNGGLRLIRQSSRVRPYVQFGGGVVHQHLTGNFAIGGQSAPQSASASIGEVAYGAGVQFFGGKKWGGFVGFDGYHYLSPLLGAGQNSGSIRIGMFYQTKSSIQ